MKKFFTIIVLVAMTLTASAEDIKLALLQPLTVSGSTECNPMEISMVRGELRKAFGWQSDFQVLTRLDVDAMLKEQGFQRSGMVDDAQRKQVGVMTGAQYICVSTITKYNTQLYIEAYLVDVETGQMTNPATQYINVQNDDYSTLPASCNELAKEMLGEIGGSKKRSSGVGLGNNKNIPAGYVDLGLPSGTLWKAENENCGLITYGQAVNFYGSSLPTKEQFEELKNNCLWTWRGNGYNLKGKNGESMFLPASGGRSCDGSVDGVGSHGSYWSSASYGSEQAWGLFFGWGGMNVITYAPCIGQSVRLVK